MNSSMLALCSFSILIAGIISGYRAKQINDEYKLFTYLIWIGCANEIISAILIQLHRPTFLNNNVYILAEGLLFAWQFYRWQIINQKLFSALLLIQISLWLLEIIVVTPHGYTAYYSIVHSFIIMLFAIKGCTVLMLTSDKLLKNPQFLINAGSIIFFYFNIVVDATWLFGENLSSHFRNQIFYIIVYVNVAVNLIFALAVLWIPEKPKYITL